MRPRSVCSRTQQNSAPSAPPEPPPTRMPLRNVTASIRVIFIGSVAAAAAASVASGPRPAPIRNVRRVGVMSSPY